jgi:hypothetical protein
LSKAYSLLDIKSVNTGLDVQKISQNKFKITDKVTNHEPIEVNLVYHQSADGKLMLAWDLIVETAKHDHLWSVRIDALNGQLLEKMI